ncbi:NAD(P)/FAD-dependent oxidoreductase [Roseovarius sp. C7]|uniref:NAD(P)/FAD-dependent oxidoreductase n=1 Tax=Roseovarius sp. C7 TaxID=3398643 RepID=UPI0039F6C3B2
MAEITVMGAGIFGLSVAWACLRRGAHVRVIDPAGPGAGASGGVVGALAPHVPENWNPKKAFQLDSLLMAEAFWAGVEEAGGVSSGYGRTGRIQPIADDAALALAEARAGTARTLWQDHATWQVIAAEDAPWAPASPSGKLIHDTLSARIHPRRACAALTAAITTAGGEILTEGVPRGPVIWATGAHDLAEMTARHSRLVGQGIKGQAALLHFDGPKLPQLFADTLHIIPHADGTVAIGSTTERDFSDPTDTDAQLDDIIERAMQAVPVLHGARIVERWAGLRPRSRSRAPMLGAHPMRPGAYIANGGFKIGFGMAPKVAEVMADLVLEGRDTIPQDFKPEASL